MSTRPRCLEWRFAHIFAQVGLFVVVLLDVDIQFRHTPAVLGPLDVAHGPGVLADDPPRHLLAATDVDGARTVGTTPTQGPHGRPHPSGVPWVAATVLAEKRPQVFGRDLATLDASKVGAEYLDEAVNGQSLLLHGSSVWPQRWVEPDATRP